MQALGWGRLYGCGLWRGVAHGFVALGCLGAGEYWRSWKVQPSVYMADIADVLLERYLRLHFGDCCC